MSVTAMYCNFLICVQSSFVGKIYRHQRSEHIPGVRFCQYLLVNLLTGRHVCFSYFIFIFSPLPVSITLSNILSETVCLPGLSDLFESKNDRPKPGYRGKEVHKKTVKSAILRILNIIPRFLIIFFYSVSVKLPFQQAYNA